MRISDWSSDVCSSDLGAEDEVTLARNRLAFSEWALVPRVFRDVSEVSGEVELLGQRLEWPLIIGPTGMPGLFHPDAEIGVARAAEAPGDRKSTRLNSSP